MTAGDRPLLVLGLESGGMSGGAALLGPDGLRGTLMFAGKSLQSQRLLPAVDDLLARCEVTLADVTAIAVSCGPGSFTGLRIGMSAAKALAYGTGAAFLAVATLEALAVRCMGASEGRLVVPLVDARNGVVYAQSFRGAPAGSVRPVAADEPRAGAFREVLADLEGDLLFTGDGAEAYRAGLEEMFGARAAFAPVHLAGLHPEAVAVVALERHLRGEQDDLTSAEPAYIAESYSAPRSPESGAGSTS